jgi:hypothetical protein
VKGNTMAVKKLKAKATGTAKTAGKKPGVVTSTAAAVPNAKTGETGTYNGYCVKCKEKRDFKGAVEISKSGMNMAKGKCPVCGTTVCRIMGKAKA